MKKKLPYTGFVFVLLIYAFLHIYVSTTIDPLLDTADMLYVFLLFLIFFYEMIKIPIFLNNYKEDHLAQVGKILMTIIDVILLLLIFIPDLIKNDKLYSVVFAMLLGLLGVINLIVLRIYYSEQKYLWLVMHGLEVISIFFLTADFLFKETKFIVNIYTLSVYYLLPYSILIKYSIRSKGK